jgi:hypothetical protein
VIRLGTGHLQFTAIDPDGEVVTTQSKADRRAKPLRHFGIEQRP